MIVIWVTEDMRTWWTKLNDKKDMNRRVYAMIPNHLWLQSYEVLFSPHYRNLLESLIMQSYLYDLELFDDNSLRSPINVYYSWLPKALIISWLLARTSDLWLKFLNPYFIKGVRFQHSAVLFHVDLLPFHLWLQFCINQIRKFRKAIRHSAEVKDALVNRASRQLRLVVRREINQKVLLHATTKQLSLHITPRCAEV